MNQKPRERTSSSEQIIRDIERKTRKQYSAEEKICIVLDGLRGEDSIEMARIVFGARTFEENCCYITNINVNSPLVTIVAELKLTCQYHVEQ